MLCVVCFRAYKRTTCQKYIFQKKNVIIRFWISNFTRFVSEWLVDKRRYHLLNKWCFLLFNSLHLCSPKPTFHCFHMISTAVEVSVPTTIAVTTSASSLSPSLNQYKPVLMQVSKSLSPKRSPFYDNRIIQHFLSGTIMWFQVSLPIRDLFSANRFEHSN